MFRLIDRIPLDKRKPAISGWLYATVMLGLFGFLGIMAYTEKETTNSTGHLWWKETTAKAVPSDTRITYLLIGIFLVFLALLCVGIALRLLTQEGRVKRYMAILKGIEAISVQQVASITSNNVPDVYRDDSADECAERARPRLKRKPGFDQVGHDFTERAALLEGLLSHGVVQIVTQ